MSEIDSNELKQAIEGLHGGTATFAQDVPVRETFEGETVWEGIVSIFDLADSPSGATRAYAWSFERENGQRRIAAVLHTDKINSPAAAVRAAIVAEQKARP